MVQILVVEERNPRRGRRRRERHPGRAHQFGYLHRRGDRFGVHQLDLDIQGTPHPDDHLSSLLFVPIGSLAGLLLTGHSLSIAS